MVTSGDGGEQVPREGYYPDPSIPGYVRYWNGAAWVPGTSRPAPAPGETLAPPPAAAKVVPPSVTPQAPPRTPAIDESGPMFLDEDPAAPVAQTATTSETSWKADPAQQTGVGEAARKVRWGSEGEAGSTADAAGTGTADPGAGAPGGAAVAGTGASGGAAVAGTGGSGGAAGGAAGSGAPGVGGGASGSGATGVGGGAPGSAAPGVGVGAAGSGAPGAGAGAPGAGTGAPGAGAGVPGGGAVAGFGPPGSGVPVSGPAAGAPAVVPEAAPGGTPAAQPPGGYSYPQSAGSGTPLAPGQAAYAYPPQAPVPGGYGFPQPGGEPVPGGYGYPQAGSDPVPWQRQVQELAGDGGAAGQALPWRPPAANPFLQAQEQARPAGTGRRLVARIIDSLLVGAVVAAAAFPLVTASVRHVQDKIDAARQSGENVQVWLIDGTTGLYLGIVLAVLLVAGVLYEALPTAKWGRTLGKKLLNLRVLDIESQLTPGFGQALRRMLVRQLLDFLVVGVVNVVWCLFDRPWRQCWHDKAARTFVAGGS
ncbi:RDD family protein [Streptantibioticus rubrisoli]|uniref:RDD family protein n=1 Tax=Streptantibioticus rubrisoli TaxID=1387313 RepID=A0ABT1PDS4_9ACTN|nr:RDD family protein [Streptantibioticus rubrisoli]MCQ4042480.1 RDD family protein [Streptantibioticus rubrisoli]